MASGTTGLTSQLRPAVSAEPIDGDEKCKEWWKKKEKRKKKIEREGSALIINFTKEI